jgi:hypothetical protein
MKSANHIEQKTGGLNPRIRAISKAAQFTANDRAAMANDHADFTAKGKLAQILPARMLMENALRRKGFPVPNNITSLSNSFYNNIVKGSKFGKNFEHVEGNPILYKLHADANVTAAAVAIIPAATSFIAYALANNDPTLDTELTQDAMDITDFINMRKQGIPTDAIPVQNFAINPWFIAFILVLLYAVLK